MTVAIGASKLVAKIRLSSEGTSGQSTPDKSAPDKSAPDKSPPYESSLDPPRHRRAPGGRQATISEWGRAAESNPNLALFYSNRQANLL